MSGPGLDYLDYRLQELGRLILVRGTCPEHRAFARHLLKCAAAAITLGNVLEDDSTQGEEIALIRAVLAPRDVLDQTIDEAHAAAASLRRELERACGRSPSRMQPIGSYE